MWGGGAVGRSIYFTGLKLAGVAGRVKDRSGKGKRGAGGPMKATAKWRPSCDSREVKPALCAFTIGSWSRAARSLGPAAA